MEREYEFFVTTDEPHQPAGVERGMIRRLVMRNYFDTKMAALQLNSSQNNSVSTVIAKKKLKNRFRISEPQSEDRYNERDGKSSGHGAEKKGAARPKALRTRSGPTLSSSVIEDRKGSKSCITKARTNSRKRNTSEPIVLESTLKADPSAHLMDPFDALPIPGTSELDTLFQLYKSAPKNNSLAIDAQHTWKPFVLNDAGLLHATIASWALYGMLASGLSDLRVCTLKYMNETIRVVNCKIATCQGYITDDVVGTVLTLANLENLLGEYDAAQLHVTALKRMVNLRGGLFAFGHNDGLLRGIIWMDFHTAAIAHTLPSFPHICLDPDTPPLPNELEEEAAHTSPTSLLHLSCSGVDCFNIFYRLHRLALATSSHWAGRVERLTLSNLLYETQYSILAVPDHSRHFLRFDQAIQDEQSDCYDYLKQRADAASVVEALLTTALIFVYAVLRALPLNTRIFTILLSRLRAALDRPNTSVLKVWRREKNLNMLLWVLVMACSVATRSEQLWWIAQLSELCWEMSVSSRDHLEHELRHVAWADLFFDDRMDGIWAEVVRLRGPPALCKVSLAANSAPTVDPSSFDAWSWGKEGECSHPGSKITRFEIR